VTLLLVGTELGDDDPAFNTLIGVARERLKRPWTSGALDLWIGVQAWAMTVLRLTR
jgi:hypothetical protein